MIRADADVEGVGRGDQDELDLPARVLAHDFDLDGARQQSRPEPVEGRYEARAFDPDRSQLRDVLLDCGFVAAGPASDDESSDLDAAQGAVDEKIHDVLQPSIRPVPISYRGPTLAVVGRVPRLFLCIPGAVGVDFVD